jgi:hypothetical protein
VLTLSSGQPININYLFEDDFNGSGEYFGRPDLVGDPFEGTGDYQRFLNLSAFAARARPTAKAAAQAGSTSATSRATPTTGRRSRTSTCRS